jgi:hypothetical protein
MSAKEAPAQQVNEQNVGESLDIFLTQEQEVNSTHVKTQSSLPTDSSLPTETCPPTNKRKLTSGVWNHFKRQNING